VRQLCDEIEELLGEVFSKGSLPPCYKQNKSKIQLVGRHSPASNGVKTEAEEAAVLEAVTRRLPAKIEQTEKSWYVM
jgi:hypothetical protein